MAPNRRLVSEVMRIRSSEIQQAPAIVVSGGAGEKFSTGVHNHSDRLLIIVDVDRMLSEEERGSLQM